MRRRRSGGQPRLPGDAGFLPPPPQARVWLWGTPSSRSARPGFRVASPTPSLDSVRSSSGLKAPLGARLGLRTRLRGAGAGLGQSSPRGLALCSRGQRAGAAVAPNPGSPASQPRRNGLRPSDSCSSALPTGPAKEKCESRPVSVAGGAGTVRCGAAPGEAQVFTTSATQCHSGAANTVVANAELRVPAAPGWWLSSSLSAPSHFPSCSACLLRGHFWSAPALPQLFLVSALWPAGCFWKPSLLRWGMGGPEFPDASL